MITTQKLQLVGKLPALSFYLLNKNRKSHIDTASIGAIPENEGINFFLGDGFTGNARSRPIPLNIVRICPYRESYVAEYFQYGMFQTELE